MRLISAFILVSSINKYGMSLFWEGHCRGGSLKSGMTASFCVLVNTACLVLLLRGLHHGVRVYRFRLRRHPMLPIAIPSPSALSRHRLHVIETVGQWARLLTKRNKLPTGKKQAPDWQQQAPDRQGKSRIDKARIQGPKTPSNTTVSHGWTHVVRIPGSRNVVTSLFAGETHPSKIQIGLSRGPWTSWA